MRQISISQYKKMMPMIVGAALFFAQNSDAAHT